MSHPFTADYIKMAAAAPEVQNVRLAKKIFQNGDFVIFESEFTPPGMVSMIDDRSFNIPQDNAKTWLPQLRQLMDLFGDFTASLEAIRSGLNAPVGVPAGYFEKFRSWEECTLAVLMLKRCKKIWDGKAWIAQSP